MRMSSVPLASPASLSSRLGRGTAEAGRQQVMARAAAVGV